MQDCLAQVCNGVTKSLSLGLYSSFDGVINKSRLSQRPFMSVEAMVQKMIDELNEALADAVKHDKGNSAAGTRVRKAMQAAKAAAQDIRVQVQNDKNN